MLYTIINAIIFSDLIGICMLVPMLLQKNEKKELGKSFERLENTLDSFTPSQHDRLTAEREGYKLALSCIQKYEEKMNTVEPILAQPFDAYKVDLKRANLLYGTGFKDWLKRQQEWMEEEE